MIGKTEISSWLMPFISIGIAATFFCIAFIMYKFQKLFADVKYLKEDIKKLENEITELKYKRKD